MGRKKIDIKYITDDKRRNSTFYKRRNGLLKKAKELATLAGVKVYFKIEDGKKNTTFCYDGGKKLETNQVKPLSEKTPDFVYEPQVSSDMPVASTCQVLQQDPSYIASACQASQLSSVNSSALPASAPPTSAPTASSLALEPCSIQNFPQVDFSWLIEEPSLKQVGSAEFVNQPALYQGGDQLHYLVHNL